VMTDAALMNKNNSAGRFLRMFHNSQGVQNNTAVSEVWAKVFELPAGLSGLDVHHEVAVLLNAADMELRAMESVLATAGLPESLLKPYVANARHALSVTILPGQWASAAQYITPELLLAFQWFSFYLEEEPTSACSEDTDELMSYINELEKHLTNGSLPPGLMHFISVHLSAIKLALRQVPISGIKSLQQTIRSTLTDLELDKEVLQAESRKTDNLATLGVAGKLLEKIWKKGAEISGDAEKYAKAGKLIGDGFDLVKGYLP